MRGVRGPAPSPAPGSSHTSWGDEERDGLILRKRAATVFFKVGSANDLARIGILRGLLLNRQISGAGPTPDLRTQTFWRCGPGGSVLANVPVGCDSTKGEEPPPAILPLSDSVPSPHQAPDFGTHLPGGVPSPGVWQHDHDLVKK